ncbi:hypothetical protein NLI96_g648 [Meripilus lineatus]|uniref:F-box domain-containing protein n=1 Tax=Meripilus lineatus TaxID=2056292 RepID=A0AAD5VCC0_9APHY|nr:hypothetical protein NLI96_g648 [Physisporinus lineatus]
MPVPKSLHAQGAHIRRKFSLRSKQHRTKTGAPTQLASAVYTQALPNELLLAIFQYLGREMFHQRYYWYTPGTPPPTEYTVTTQESRRALVNCLLTCSDWYYMVVEFLYQEPQISHKRQLRRFTLSVEQYPHLSSRVKALSLSVFAFPKFPHDLFGVAARGRERCRGYISRIFAACSSITRVDFAFDVLLGNAIGKYLQCAYSSPTIRLRQLTLRGGTFHGPISNLYLPNLEVLCLSQHFNFGEFILPSLPRLHTLQIVGVYTVSPYVLEEAHLPSLRLLQLFSGTYDAPVFDLDNFPKFSTLERIELLGTEEVMFFPPVQAAAVFQTIKGLVLGPLGADTEWLPSWRIPRKLESLVVFLEFSDEKGVSDKVLRNLLHCLRASHKSIKWNLKQLVVVAKPDAFDMAFSTERTQTFLDQLRLSCMGWGVSLKMGEIGQEVYYSAMGSSILICI